MNMDKEIQDAETIAALNDLVSTFLAGIEALPDLREAFDGHVLKGSVLENLASAVSSLEFVEAALIDGSK